jgi:hypothetical protein
MKPERSRVSRHWKAQYFRFFTGTVEGSGIGENISILLRHSSAISDKSNIDIDRIANRVQSWACDCLFIKSSHIASSHESSSLAVGYFLGIGRTPVCYIFVIFL